MQPLDEAKQSMAQPLTDLEEAEPVPDDTAARVRGQGDDGQSATDNVQPIGAGDNDR